MAMLAYPKLYGTLLLWGLALWTANLQSDSGQVAAGI